SWVRIDTDSIAKYGSGKIKVINSRWLSNLNLAGAQKAATLIGRRFADIQRKITFQLDPKDSDGATGLWTGQTRNINYRDICDFNGYPVDTMFQIISASQSRNYKFSGIEFKYGDELADDITVTDKIVYYSGEEGADNITNVNLMADWESLYQPHEADSEAIFVVKTGTIMGSSSISTYSIETGAWPNLTTGFVKIIIQSGSYVAGKGGDGANGDNTPAAENGGGAINLGVDVILEGGGVLGGGGGGGGGKNGAFAEAAGGGGAGSAIGSAGQDTRNTGGTSVNSLIHAEDGTVSTGGAGGFISIDHNGEPFDYTGGDGGDLGEAGTLSGGTAGKACNLNGYTLDQSSSGVTIEGAVS
ncbi:MAG: hypothetical protein GY814_02790, partial [Gammaproteobacteria bacterium]|nr:hypothetical protein [Gammaproteobacteria bacterium]